MARASASVAPMTTSPPHESVNGDLDASARTAAAWRAKRSGGPPQRFHPSASRAASVRTTAAVPPTHTG